MRASTSIYIRQLRPYKATDPETEQDLIRKAQNGCIDSRNNLITSNLRLVLSVATAFLYTQEPYEDLISAGNIGLIDAIKCYKFGKGTKFSTYAVIRIKQTITRYLDNHGRTVRIPCNILEKMQQYRKFVISFTNKVGREPTDAEIIKELKISSKRRLDIMLKTYQTPVYIDETNDEENPNKPLAVFEPAVVYNFDKMIDAKKILLNSKLTQQEMEIVMRRYAQSESLHEVGKSFKLTRERIRQIENGALRKMRKYAEVKPFKLYKKGNE